MDPAELFECPVTKTEANEKQRVPQMLKAEARNADYLVLWLDCDKEGENICFEITDILQDTMNLVPGRTLFRARFSALTGPDLSYAMDHLTIPNENESKSVDARQELDLRIGCCFTRFQTRAFHVIKTHHSNWISKSFELFTTYYVCLLDDRENMEVLIQLWFLMDLVKHQLWGFA